MWGEWIGCRFGAPELREDVDRRQQEARVPSRSMSDETYVIDLCDEVLGTVALRQHRFDFLRGDAGPGKQGTRLPADANCPELQLVVEYCERQYTEAIPIVDRRMTVSGVDRGTQWALDGQRRALLPKPSAED